MKRIDGWTLVLIGLGLLLAADLFLIWLWVMN